jgi:hypothetical protein
LVLKLMLFSVFIACLTVCQKKKAGSKGVEQIPKQQHEGARPTDSELLPSYLDETIGDISPDLGGFVNQDSFTVSVAEGAFTNNFSISLKTFHRTQLSDAAVILGAATIAARTEDGNLVRREELIKPFTVTLRTELPIVDPRQVYVKVSLRLHEDELVTQIIYYEDITIVAEADGSYTISFATTDTEAEFLVMEAKDLPTTLDRYIPPPPPISSKDIEAGVVTVDTIAVRWKNVGGTAIGYVLKFAEGKDLGLNCINGQFLDSTSYVATSLARDTYYTFIICSINSRPDGADLAVGAPLSVKTLRDPSEQNLKTLPDSIVVKARFPLNGRNWNDYVKGTVGESVDEICSILDKNCTHGAEYKEISVSGVSTCDGLTIEEALDAFYWRCELVGGIATFYSYGLKDRRFLSTLLSNEKSIFLDNSVVIRRGSEYTVSAASKWWSNGIEHVSDGAQLQSLNVPGKIYVFPGAITIDQTITVLADKVSLVGMPDQIITTEPATSTDFTAISATSRKHLWIEGTFKFYKPTSQLGATIHLNNTTYSRIDRVDYYRGKVHLTNSSSSNHIRDFFSFAVAGSCLFIEDSSNNLLRQINCAANDIFVTGDSGDNTILDSIGMMATQEMIGVNIFETGETSSTVTLDISSLFMNYASNAGTDIKNKSMCVNCAGKDFYFGAPGPNYLYGRTLGALCENFAESNVLDAQCSTSPSSDISFSTQSYTSSYYGWFGDQYAVSAIDPLFWMLKDSFTGWKDFASAGHCGPENTCKRFDYSLKITDTVLRNTLSCPDSDKALTHTLKSTNTVTFLKNASELIGFGGNNNGLCESSEHCLYTPNIGVYQGHGELIRASSATSGTNTCQDLGENGAITDVTLYKYTTNGRAIP